MRKIWCRLWNTFLNVFQDATNAVATSLETVGTVAVKVLGAVGEVVGDTIGSVFGGSNLLVWCIVGFIGYKLLTKQDDPSKQRSILGQYGVTNDGVN